MGSNPSVIERADTRKSKTIISSNFKQDLENIKRDKTKRLIKEREMMKLEKLSTNVLEAFSKKLPNNKVQPLRDKSIGIIKKSESNSTKRLNNFFEEKKVSHFASINM